MMPICGSSSTVRAAGLKTRAPPIQREDWKPSAPLPKAARPNSWVAPPSIENHPGPLSRGERFAADGREMVQSRGAPLG